jgi:caffeic acid 3-O-methyltransferase / acetylserotonin O-methyltransferase
MGSVEDYHVAMVPRDEVDEEACMQALQLASASILPMTLKAAIELDVLEILVKGCGGPFGKPIMTPTDVAAHLKTENSQVRAFVYSGFDLVSAYLRWFCDISELLCLFSCC